MAGATQQTQQSSLALMKRDVVDVVEEKVRQFQQSGQLALPANYSAENAMKSAWLILQTTVDKDKRPVLEVCTKNSIANALLDMVVQGLNPAKRQCYFIAYGNQLLCQRSYFGDMALVQRILPQSEIWYGVVYAGDQFEYSIERGRRVITKHIQALGNVAPDKIVAAYCVIEPGEGRPAHTEIMTIDQIKRSWLQSKQYKPDGGNTPHHSFTDQMCLRTVIRRACKAVINSSSDDYLLLQHVKRSDEDMAEIEAEADAAEHANGEIIDIEPGESEAVDELVDDVGATPDGPQPAAGTLAGDLRRPGPGF